LKKTSKNLSRRCAQPVAGTELSAAGIPSLECRWRWSVGAGLRSNSNGKTFFGSFFQKSTAFFRFLCVSLVLPGG
jgi:hypothetical protein